MRVISCNWKFWFRWVCYQLKKLRITRKRRFPELGNHCLVSMIYLGDYFLEHVLGGMLLSLGHIHSFPKNLKWMHLKRWAPKWKCYRVCPGWKASQLTNTSFKWIETSSYIWSIWSPVWGAFKGNRDGMQMTRQDADSMCALSCSCSPLPPEQWKKPWPWLFRVHTGLYYPFMWGLIIRNHYKDPIKQPVL